MLYLNASISFEFKYFSGSISEDFVHESKKVSKKRKDIGFIIKK
jgi:hypothetical protein